MEKSRMEEKQTEERDRRWSDGRKTETEEKLTYGTEHGLEFSRPESI